MRPETERRRRSPDNEMSIFNNDRVELEIKLEQEINGANLIEIMLESEENGIL